MQSQTPIATGATVAVAPTRTLIIGPVRLTRGQTLAVSLVNNAGDGQTLAAWGETAPTETAAKSDPIGMGLDAVVDGKSGVGSLTVPAPQWAWVYGTAGGAGLNCAAYGWTLADHP